MRKICLVGGWTWWHITPLVSIYRYLQNDAEFFWIWEKWWLEEKIAQDNKIRFFGIKAWKLRRYFSLKTLLEPFNIIAWCFQAYSILKSNRPDVIFSKWWFVSFPVAVAASALKIRLYLHESDTVPWLANRMVWKFATKVFLGFEDAKMYFNTIRTEVVGQILSPVLFEGIPTKSVSPKTNLIVFAGSQGSKRIFDSILANVENLADFDITIVLWSLNLWFRKDFEKFTNITCYDFIWPEEIKKLFLEADVAITRAWATSLAELEAFGIKMIIIPLKESANNHQYFNALSYKARWEEMLEEKDMDMLTEVVSKYKGYKKWEIDFKKWGALEVIRREILG